MQPCALWHAGCTQSLLLLHVSLYLSGVCFFICFVCLLPGGLAVPGLSAGLSNHPFPAGSGNQVVLGAATQPSEAVCAGSVPSHCSPWPVLFSFTPLGEWSPTQFDLFFKKIIYL